MKLTLTCPDCGAQLGVDETLLGRKVRCTKCQAVFMAEAPPALGGTASPEAIREKTEEEFFKVRDESIREQPGRPAESVKPARVPSPDPYDDDDDLDDDDDYRPRRRKRFRSPHRGGSVLGYGIASIVTPCLCVFLGIGLGIKAVSMANEDLQAMNDGRMDESGRGTTQAGKICGIIGIVLSILMLICNIIVMAASQK
jgi:predicted Zn finger-like uncharacterized protein